MNPYFNCVSDNLTLDDIEVLNSLSKHSALNKMTARTKKEIMKDTDLTEAIVRKSIDKLDSILFIETCSGKRKHLYFITEYGMEAIQYIFERTDV